MSTTTLVAINRLDEIERISLDVDGFGLRHRLPPRLVFDANLALDEVLTNVISYAYADAGEHEIVIRLAVDAGRLVIEVEDDGRPFDPLEAAAPDLALSAEQRPVGGLGLSLVRQLMPELRYERRAGRNVLTMARPIDHAAGRSPRSPLRVGEQRDPAVLVLRPDGRLDSAGAAAFEKELLGRIAAGDRRVVLDFAGVDYINSAGIRVLLIAAKRLLAASGAIAITGARGQIRSVLEMVGFDSVFPVCDTIDEARAAVLARAAQT